MRILVTLLVVVLFFLVLMFCVENMEQQVTVHFLSYHSPPLPVFALALAATLSGVLFTGLLTLAESIKLRMRNLQMARRVRKLEAEIDSLRNLALGPAPPPSPPAEEEPAPGAPPTPAC